MSEESIDPALLSLLEQLWRAAYASPQKAWSLAKLSKQSQLQMSTMRRILTHLADDAIVEVHVADDGTGSAMLTAHGIALCEEIFPVADIPMPPANDPQ